MTFTLTKPARQPEPQDDAALFSRRNVELARQHLASLTPERRAQLQREWEN
ncbi:hypothetical protein J2792_002380 [Novosphingobium capsulatum]|uniref:Uncharacterized protein n=1 Tax=Novosphingobium capsulatum TaxID=13688 RepID=A0ABU1MMF0_9SPHN|nr:hypothetical protein [Novosphingobium capsulatum]MDR6511508.1 hypothetical protein [Novosphingobium capsulatum]